MIFENKRKIHEIEFEKKKVFDWVEILFNFLRSNDGGQRLTLI